MNWLERQLLWYHGSAIAQDVDLLQFVTDHNINSIGYLGDSDYLKVKLKKEKNYNLDLCVYLVNHEFKFSELVAHCNQIIPTLLPNGYLYLALNKFLAVPECVDIASEDYDDAILQYVQSTVDYPIIKYVSGKDDGGRKFNWVHPITRFYFQNDHSV